MSLLNLRTSWKYIVVAITAIVLTYLLGPKRIEYKEKTVTKIQERVRVLTKTIERPDGTKITTIDSRTDTDTSVVSQKESRPSDRQWLISTTMTQDVSKWDSPTYGIGVSKRLLLGLYGGIYATSSKNIGITISYNF